jgi:hypothetical protein
MMKKTLGMFAVAALAGVFVLTGCGKNEDIEMPVSPRTEVTSAAPVKAVSEKQAVLEVVEVPEGEELVYLKAVGGEASSFDQTPDWAPEPNPMAAADGDMLTRWSSDYKEGPQWIYFDLGKESVVSNVIVRWERAHATDYKIQGSLDKETWADLYHEANGKGATMESVFGPSKARYVKVLGLERVNEDWGISIWEVEIYGPRSFNPEAAVTREEYLSKGDEDASRKEAEDLLERLAAVPVPIIEQPFQKAVVYTSWMGEEFLLPVSDLTLGYLKGLGFDTVGIMVPAYQDEIDSKVVFTNDTPDGDTPTDEALKHVIASCHKIGLRVLLKPHIDPRTDEPRINIMPSEEWFDSFEAFTVRYAKMAQENNVEIFCIGTELEATTFSAWAARWNRLIDKVEEVYDGILTYAANWTEYKEVPFWDRMDFIGIDAYFPLSEKDNPSKQELEAAWTKIADEIEAWRIERGLTDKGVVLTEIGYPSAQGAARQPWVALSNIENQKEQADCLDATFEVLTKRDWFEGYYIWQFFPQDRWSPLGFTVKGKQSEEVIKKWLQNHKQ